jgi:hypothetical protein
MKPVSPAPHDPVGKFDFEGARQAILRYQPALNWVSRVNPGPRTVIGYGFDLGRSDAAAVLGQVGLDHEAALLGRVPISDEQMNELFNLALAEAVDWADGRIPGFADLRAEAQWALLEMIVWLGPDGRNEAFDLLERHSVPITHEPIQPSAWFDANAETAAAAARDAAPVPDPGRTRQPRPHGAELRAWTGAIELSLENARKRYESASGASFAQLPQEVQAVLTEVQRNDGDRARRFWRAVTDHRWMEAQFELRSLAPPDWPVARYSDQAAVLERALQAGRLPGERADRLRASPPSEPSVSNGASGTVFESFGLVAELVTDDPELLVSALAVLPPGWREVDGKPNVQFGVRRDGSITIDGVQAVRVRDREGCLLKLGAVVRHHLASKASAYLFVKAGVVGADGCGIVIPGGPYTGKSTLVAEIVHLGATYFSDEYAVVDPDGFVHPFAKPLSLRGGRHGGLGQLVPVPASQIANDPIRASLIVLTSYVRGAEWRPSVRSCAEGALALLENTVSAPRELDTAVTATRRLAHQAVVLAGQRGEACETARAILEAALTARSDRV